MRRPPSYSDSFLVIPYRNKDSAINLSEYDEALLASSTVGTEAAEAAEAAEGASWGLTTTLFLFKGSFHILCISFFETTFYFLYVNRSEDAGILSTIDTYYKPLVENCNTRWTNVSRWLIKELFTYGLNQTAIDSAGVSASAARVTYNNSLILKSSLYSVAALLFCASLVYTVHRAKWKVAWSTVVLENLLFIGVLAAYEFFFYNTIIYKYITLTTDELNKHIVDGIAQCIV
jgi:hypothetical protein